ncbi:hypothetical protein ACOMHN_023390 [Nucella lapillus]
MVGERQGRRVQAAGPRQCPGPSARVRGPRWIQYGHKRPLIGPFDAGTPPAIVQRPSLSYVIEAQVTMISAA